MNLDWFLARRYLSARGSGRFLSLITWIALAGVTVGVSALIVVIAVMSGMQEDLREKILDINPHINILRIGQTLRMDDWEVVLDSVRAGDEVTAVAPFVTSTVVARRVDYARSAQLWGLRVEDTGEFVTEVQREIGEQIDQIRESETDLHPIVLGSGFAETMQLFIGDTLTVIAIENLRTDALGNLNPAIRLFEVTGTFTSGLFDYDQEYVYTTLEAAQDLLGYSQDNIVSGLAARVDDPWRAEERAVQLESRLGFPFAVRSWETQNRSLFSALKLEKLAMGLVLGLIVLVAAFNIVGTLVMVVASKTREIGILKSMGMTDRRIRKVFVFQGIWIGVIGAAAGLVLGLAACYVLDRYPLIELPPDVYFIDGLPIAVDPIEVGLIVVLTLVVSFIATQYPAALASRLRPVEAIRHE